MIDRLPPVPVLSPADLRARIESGVPVLLLDVREDEERALCRIHVGAVDLHVPLGQVPLRVDEIRAAAARAAGELVVYCHHGIRSLVAARWLSTQEIPAVSNLDGGIDAWSAQVDPTVPRY